jgi:DNA-binding CsgD family transcriptional regulator
MAATLRRQQLSRREAEVLPLIVEGLTDKEVAVRLGIGAVTVRTHVASLRRKLGARNGAQPGAKAARLAHLTERSIELSGAA